MKHDPTFYGPSQDLGTAKCPICGTEFAIRRTWQKYDKTSCRREAGKQEYRRLKTIGNIIKHGTPERAN